jgi:hypothetical protein
MIGLMVRIGQDAANLYYQVGLFGPFFSNSVIRGLNIS